MAQQLDALGRLPKQYRPLTHPFGEFSERKFRLRYRVSKDTAQEVIDHMRLVLPQLESAAGGGLSLEDKFCLSVRYLATGANMSVVGDYQGVSKATVSRANDAVVKYFYDYSDRYIKWPTTPQEKAATAAGFLAKTGLPLCIGIADGTHIAVKCPTVKPQAYINRHGYNSINTLVVCDAAGKITHIDPTWAGSVGDAHAFNLGHLRPLCNDGSLNPYYILADSAYQAAPNIFPPVRIEANARQHRYNRWHRTHRSQVETVIGGMKCRFRRIDGHGGYLYHTVHKCVRIITACACLYNLALQDGNDFDPNADEEEDIRILHGQIPLGGNVPQAVANGPNDDPAVRDAYITAHF